MMGQLSPEVVAKVMLQDLPSTYTWSWDDVSLNIINMTKISKVHFKNGFGDLITQTSLQPWPIPPIAPMPIRPALAGRIPLPPEP